MVDAVKASAGRVGRGRRERLLLATKVTAGAWAAAAFFAAVTLEILHSLATHVLRSGWVPPSMGFAVWPATVVALLFGAPSFALAWREPRSVQVYAMNGPEVRRWEGRTDA